MMKKIVLASAIVLGSLSFVACDSDDNSSNQNQMVGTWAATEFSYTRPDNGTVNTHAYSLITGGCDVDLLTITNDTNVMLIVDAKNTEDICEETTLSGNWTTGKIIIEGEKEPREVVSVNESELVLKYETTFANFPLTEITVTYNRQ